MYAIQIQQIADHLQAYAQWTAHTIRMQNKLEIINLQVCKYS